MIRKFFSILFPIAVLAAGCSQLEEPAPDAPETPTGSPLVTKSVNSAEAAQAGTLLLYLDEEVALKLAQGEGTPEWDQACEELGVEYVELDELFARSDVLGLQMPLFPFNTGIINKENISKMKDGVIIINNSRGQMVVEHQMGLRPVRQIGGDVIVTDFHLAVLHVLGMHKSDAFQHSQFLQQHSAHQAIKVTAGHQTIFFFAHGWSP